MSPPTSSTTAATEAALDLEDLGLDQGGHILLSRALAVLEPGDRLAVSGRAPELAVHLRAWCRSQGHDVEWPADPEPGDPVAKVVRGRVADQRWLGAERAGGSAPETVAQRAPATWGVAARGALVEAGSPAFPFPLDDRSMVWTEDAARFYRQAAAAQWDPATAVPWDAAVDLPVEVEAAVVQVMTYLVENEHAALAVPARFLGRIHPHFREVVGVLAVQVADEARHVEVFSRRASLRGFEMGASGAGGQASLLTLFEEPDFALAHFLLSVLGEGTFLALLAFIERHAPDPVTATVARLALADEARHVAFGMAHLGSVVTHDPAQRSRLAGAIHRRHDVLATTAGLNADVVDALTLLAAGALSPRAIAEGFARVQALEAEMADGRRRRLVRLGFPPAEAGALAALHTRNFM